MFLRQLLIQIAIALGYWIMPPSKPDKKPPTRPQPKLVIRKPVKGLPYDVHSLSDGDLARQLKSYGQVVGPITETTRPLYQKKLVKLLQEESKKPAGSQTPDKKPRPWEYSDKEEEEAKEEVMDAKPGNVTMENGDDHDEEDADDEIDAVPEPQLTKPYPRRTKKAVEKPKEEEEVKPSAPQCVKRETIIQETYMTTRKRTAAEKASSKSETVTAKTEVTPNVPKQAKSKSSFWWKVIIFLILIVSIALLVVYFMEGNPVKPSIAAGRSH
ncbi:LEM protein 2 isoform X2 [Nematostella vectensis]|uniref:LEM protein 2 isoform X2 n=1 Tax=Nematostella vectensis TaxID=45351 RepID=UPI00207716B3|nr:LEM protein 2 isoform X2 [Nematostella vectensis]